MVRVHFGPPLLKQAKRGSQDRDDRGIAAMKPKWTRKAALGLPLLRRRWRSGGLAQLGERLPCKQEVSGSIPLISTNLTKEVAIGKIEFLGSERPLLTTCRWHVVTAVAFPQKSDPANLHHILKRLTEVPSEEETSLSLLKGFECTLKTEHCDYEMQLREGNSKENF